MVTCRWMVTVGVFASLAGCGSGVQKTATPIESPASEWPVHAPGSLIRDTEDLLRGGFSNASSVPMNIFDFGVSLGMGIEEVRAKLSAKPCRQTQSNEIRCDVEGVGNVGFYFGCNQLTQAVIVYPTTSRANKEHTPRALARMLDKFTGAKGTVIETRAGGQISGKGAALVWSDGESMIALDVFSAAGAPRRAADQLVNEQYDCLLCTVTYQHRISCP